MIYFSPKDNCITKTKIFSFLVISFVVFLLNGCDTGKKEQQDELSGSNMHLSQNFSSLVLDSTTIASLLKKLPVSDSIKKKVNLFYKGRDYQFAWFNKTGVKQAVSIFYSRLQNYRFSFADSSISNPRLDTLIVWANSDEKKFLSQPDNVQQLELLLTVTFFKYAKKAYGGVTKNLADLEWFIPRQKKNYQILLDSLISITRGENVKGPLNEYYFRLKQKLIQYRDIQKKGGFPSIGMIKKSLSAGDKDSCLIPVKKHLVSTNDLHADDHTIFFTDSLSKAVKNFQRRMGLVENGIIDTLTLAELNKSIDFRIKQIIVNMERLRWMPAEMESDYLLINIPEFKLHVFENGKPVWITNIVVGKSATQTSIFKSNLSQIILNPYWNVPTSIIQNEILAKIKRNPSYLAENNMEVVSGNKTVNPSAIHWNSYKTGVPFTIRQKSGKTNALGKILFLFPNNYDIYLHDTPSKNLFNDTKRAFSHGCIRVEDPKKLALYLLRKDSSWNEAKVADILKTDKLVAIHLLSTIPVYIVYFTVWVDNTGQLNFRNDLYNLDDKLLKEIIAE